MTILIMEKIIQGQLGRGMDGRAAGPQCGGAARGQGPGPAGKGAAARSFVLRNPNSSISIRELAPNNPS